MSFFVKITDLDRLATSGEFQVLSDLLQLDYPSRVFLDLQQKDIAAYRREGSDLIIEAVDGSKLRIANFYQTSGDCQLYLKGDDGGLMLAVLSPVDDSGSLFSQYVPLTEASPFESVEEETRSDSDGTGVGGWWSDNWGLVGFALLGLGAAGAAVGGIGGGGGSGGDHTPPAVPDVASVTAGNEAFPIGASTIINDTQPTFSGFGATAGDTIKLYESSTVIGSAVVEADGTWSITSPILAQGPHSFTLTATDSSGNESAASAGFTVTIDTDGTLDGTAGNDLLIGGTGNDVLNGGDGNDTLVDGVGSDSFDAGAGDDQIVINGTGFTSIDGGIGFDVLVLELEPGINFDATAANPIVNIERVDLASDMQASILTLDAATVEAMTDADNELQIVGDPVDTLNVSGFTATGTTQTVDGINFVEYQSASLATLLVDEDIVVNS